MLPKPLLGWLRFGVAALVGLSTAVAVMWWASPGSPVVDAEDLAANPGARLGSEVIVTGEWVTAAPSERGYMVVVLRGRDGDRLVCHFEEVPAASRAGLETCLLRPGKVTIRGRCDGVEDGQAVLRGCSLLD